LHTALEGRAGRRKDATGGSGRWPSGADGAPVLETGRTEGGGRDQEVAAGFKCRSMAPLLLALWSPLASCLHDTAPWLLASCSLTGFSPRHDRDDVSSYGAKALGAMLSTYGAKALGIVLWFHSCNCFPQRSICKILRKRTKVQIFYHWLLQTD
jgi:hypothetical protein